MKTTTPIPAPVAELRKPPTWRTGAMTAEATEKLRAARRRRAAIAKLATRRAGR